MDIYENIVIGNFLYSLGLTMGNRVDAKDVPIAAALMQQTPIDRLLGDVLIQGCKVMRLLEFKRASNRDLAKEETKLALLTNALEGQPELKRISRRVHWYIETPKLISDFNARIVPYLDFEQSRVSGTPMRDFITTIVDEALGPENNDAQYFSAYLQEVVNSQGSPKGSFGGFLVALDANGQIHSHAIEDLRDLRLEMSKYIAREQARQLELSLSMERTREQELDRSMGMSR